MRLYSDKYCHKFYAHSMVGYGVDINAPRPPFVLFKVIHRNAAIRNILIPFYALSKVLAKIIASVVGYFVGFMFGDDEVAEVVRQPVSRDQRIPRPSWGPDLSMMDDEYL